MESFDENVKKHWNHYLDLEKAFIETKKFVEFDKKNYDTFSLEFCNLFSAICNEIDVLGKLIAHNIGNKPINRMKSIMSWYLVIQDSLLSLDVNNYYRDNALRTNLRDSVVHNYYFDEDFQPWKDFEVATCEDENGREVIVFAEGCFATPSWWSDYNLVKHHRTEMDENGQTNYQRASLLNVCLSISALYILEIWLLELSADNQTDLESFFNESKLFYKVEFATDADIEALFQDRF